MKTPPRQSSLLDLPAVQQRQPRPKREADATYEAVQRLRRQGFTVRAEGANHRVTSPDGNARILSTDELGRFCEQLPSQSRHASNRPC